MKKKSSFRLCTNHGLHWQQQTEKLHPTHVVGFSPMLSLLCCRIKNFIAVRKWVRFSEWLLCTFKMNAHPGLYGWHFRRQKFCVALLFRDATAFELIAWWILMCLKKFLITLHLVVVGGDDGSGASTHTIHPKLQIHFVAFGSRNYILLGKSARTEKNAHSDCHCHWNKTRLMNVHVHSKY